MDSTPEKNRSNEIDANNLKRLSEWIHCICVVTFDLELGQAMEAIYPRNAELSEKEKLNICYLAFPDSNSGCMGDTQFHIRLRVAPGTNNTMLNPELQRFSLQCVTVQRPDLGHYWGYVYFRQTKDPSLPRGYFQKSVIILSRLPFTNLFYEIIALIAPKYFERGEYILDDACMDISNWPPIIAGECIQLPILSTIFQTYIPSLTSANLQQVHTEQYPTNIEENVNDDDNENDDDVVGIGDCKNVKNDKNIENNLKSLNVNSKMENHSNEIDVMMMVENVDNTSANQLTRENILENYKQSKELLLTNKMNTIKLSAAHCSKDSIDECNYDDFESDDVNDDDSFSDIKSDGLSIDTKTISITRQLLPSSSTTITSARTPFVLSSVQEIDIFRSLYTVISYTHLLWELVLTAEPIVVMGTSPSDCSHMVQSLISMIAPLSYSAEARPYFTIHDSEFKEFTQQQGTKPIILGVTNPFFSKTLQHWPHLIRLPDSNNGSSIIVNCTGNAASISTNNIQSHSSHQQTHGLRKLKIFSKLTDTPPGVYTQYKPFLQKDKSMIRNLMAGVKKQRPAEVQSAILRRHLLELTQSFIIPLERYMASLMPLQKDISAFRSAPVPNHFKPDQFLATLEQSGPQLTSTLKGDWCGLYKRFFRSPNFRDWYETRYKELTQTLQLLQLQALSNVNLKQWVKDKHEVEIVDMILKVKQKLEICNQISLEGLPQVIVSQNKNTRQQLLRHLDDMKRLLPDDLKKIIT